MIAEECKPYKIGETRILLVLQKWLELYLVPKVKKKLKKSPFLNATVNQKIADLFITIKKQAISEIKNFHLNCFPFNSIKLQMLLFATSSWYSADISQKVI